MYEGNKLPPRLSRPLDAESECYQPATQGPSFMLAPQVPKTTHAWVRWRALAAINAAADNRALLVYASLKQMKKKKNYMVISDAQLTLTVIRLKRVKTKQEENAV